MPSSPLPAQITPYARLFAPSAFMRCHSRRRQSDLHHGAHLHSLVWYSFPPSSISSASVPACVCVFVCSGAAIFESPITEAKWMFGTPPQHRQCGRLCERRRRRREVHRTTAEKLRGGGLGSRSTKVQRLRLGTSLCDNEAPTFIQG